MSILKRYLAAWSVSTLALGVFASQAFATPHVEVSNWGKMADGQAVKIITLKNDHGVKARVLTYGGIIQSVDTPDKNGKIQDIALGFPRLSDYLKHNDDAFFGAVLGRVANRIANGTFTIDGKTFHTAANEGTHTLHGGPSGFKDKLWQIDSKGSNKTGAWVKLRLVSADNDQGFPGNLTTYLTYKLTDNDDFSLNFNATTDKPTIVNLSTHNYWNINGEGSGNVESERLTIAARRFVPTTLDAIPTGKLQSVSGTPFDFRKGHAIGQDLRSSNSQMLGHARGYDKCFVIDGTYGNGKPVRSAAKLVDDRSGRVLEVSSNMPGMQFYTSNNIFGDYVGPSGRSYRQTDSVAFEPEFFPDSIHHAKFPNTILKPGQTYDYTTVFHFSTVK